MTTTTPTVPLPPGFVSAGDWDGRSGADMPYRLVFGADRTITDHAVRVSISAFQRPDGSLARRWAGEAPSIAVLNGDKWPLNGDQARELAAVLLAAADELDALTEGDAL
jgi:hypothetical protein